VTSNSLPSKWKQLRDSQPISWPQPDQYEAVLTQIRAMPPLVFAGEIRTLKESLAEAAQGRAFLLQGGDCAEDFSRCTAVNIREALKVLLQMAIVLTYGSGKPVVKVARMAGQYGKPRSSATEVVNGIEMPSYRGDNVNLPIAEPLARIPDPNRLLMGYHYSAATLNLLRAFTKGGYADLHRIHAWNKEFVANSPAGQSYEALARQIDSALNFLKACGVNVERMLELQQVDVYTSHEALILGYEDALTRQDSITGDWYDCSAHFVWIGDRTRQLDGAHVDFMRQVKNPIGVKVGPTTSPDELNRLIEILNPDNEYGRLTLITRFGHEKVAKHLPDLIRAVSRAGQKVLWSCDPMHGNTFKADSGYKTRHFRDILLEIKGFFDIHESEGTIPGGVHFEMTGEDVTECLGGAQQIEDNHLANRYFTNCDPRLNAQQALEVAFLLAEGLKRH